ncbi:YhcB family protein [Colwellia sp. D2M02]|uniref:YhcB family protein n=1 Tax=Colwellia sp. D2M02 TaxID=2841562 RepID=UPI001C094872|nr:DUF1043 family protein [Colwellia sp. D2M02]MBU2893628.1 YhcB family protein [Colwellia sp. D2M02]
MNELIILASLVAGGIIGFFANRLLSSSSKEQRKLVDQATKSEAALEQYKLDVADHLANSAKLLERMNSTCQTAMKQMHESTQLLQQATHVDVENMPFFSVETQQQLAQTANLRHPKGDSKSQEEVTEAPLDYSGNPSGLFADNTQTVTTAK